MKFFSILVLVSCFTLTGFSQDVLVKMNGDSIPIQILEIQEHYLVYKKLNLTEERTFTTSRKKLDRIVYENGKNFIFAEEAYVPQTIELDPEIERKNIEREKAIVRIRKKLNAVQFHYGFWGPSIKANQIKLSPLEVKMLYKDNQQASDLYRRGRWQNIFGNIIGFPAGYFFGREISKGFSSKHEMSEKRVLVSGLVGLISIAFNLNGINKIRESVKVYHNGLKPENEPSLGFGATSNGLGLVMTF